MTGLGLDCFRRDISKNVVHNYKLYWTPRLEYKHCTLHASWPVYLGPSRARWTSSRVTEINKVTTCLYTCNLSSLSVRNLRPWVFKSMKRQYCHVQTVWFFFLSLSLSHCFPVRALASTIHTHTSRTDRASDSQIGPMSLSLL